MVHQIKRKMKKKNIKENKSTKVSEYQLQTASSKWNSIFNYEQAGKSRASFPLASSNSNVIETMYANLVRH